MPLDADRLSKTCVYESQAPIATIPAELLQLESLAFEWSRARRRLRLAGIGTLLAGIGSLLFFPPAGAALIVIAIGLFFVMKLYPRAVAKDSFRREFTKTVVGWLGLDADPKAKATMRLAFDPQRELLSETAWPQRKRGRQRIYRAPWFSVEASFLDGTTFSETVAELVRQRSFTNPRGKSKTMTRIRHLVVLRFAYPPKVYGDLTSLAAKMRQEIRVPPLVSVRGLEVNGRTVKVKALVTQSADLGRTSSMLALGVYRMINLSGRLQTRNRVRPEKRMP